MLRSTPQKSYRAANKSRVPGATILSTALLEAWRDAVLALAKLPRGTERKNLKPGELLGLVIRQERGATHQLWETFTQQRNELTRSLLNPRQQTVSYLLGFHLPNAARMELLLNRLGQRIQFHDFLRTLTGTLRWTDLGCGSGALTQAFIHHAAAAGFDLKKFEAHLVDQSGGLLDAAKLVLHSQDAPYRVFTHRTGLEQLPEERYRVGNKDDVAAYALGYVWNEIEQNRIARAKIMRILNAHAKRDERSLVFLLEPASEEQSRAAMMLRDELTEAGYEPLYPCPSRFNCPMLTRPRDWCYSEGTFNRPLVVEQIDRALGIDRSHIASSMYVFASPALAPQLQRQKTLAPAHSSTEPRIIVGRPERRGLRKTKQKPEGFDYLLCTPGGLTKEEGTPGKFFRLRGTILKPLKD